MPKIKILTEAELRTIVSLDLSAVDCIERGFASLAEGNVEMPTILSMAISEFNGEVDVKTAYVSGIENFAIKISPGFFDNPKLGLPSTSGLMALFSSKTGVLQALLLDNGYLTNVRTAAAGAVAARYMARENSTHACVIGTGQQAKLQLKALKLVRPINSAVIWGRDGKKAKDVASSLSQELDMPISASTDVKNSISRADVVITTTSSSKPIVMADWLQPGQHVTAMGSDQGHKCELEPACLLRADLYVPDRQSQTKDLGELRSAILAETIKPDRVFSELGDIIIGKAKGRNNSNSITIADLTGTGVQDTVISTLALKKATLINSGSDFIS